jgi:dynein heavy chain 1
VVCVIFSIFYFSVLDDNKLLTLPNGERLALTENIRIVFEVQDLRFATLATVSRCGMVWFADHIVNDTMVYHHRLAHLKKEPVVSIQGHTFRNWQSTQTECVAQIESYFCSDEKSEASNDSFVSRALALSAPLKHVMTFSRIRMLTSLFSLLRGGFIKVLEYNEAHPDFPLSPQLLEAFWGKYLFLSIIWSFGGSLNLQDRLEYTRKLQALTSVSFPAEVLLSASQSTSYDVAAVSVLDYEVRVETGEWQVWADRVNAVELDTHKVIAPDVVIETVDTVRHVDVLGSWLADHRPLILCGPPGSGKSMTLTSVLRSLPDCDLVTLNFSSSTQPDLILRTFDHYCKCDKTPTGLVLRPQNKSKWLVIFCDEINLPATDAYGTQKVITFLRQIAEHGGFWRASDHTFVTLDRIQFVAACNPPTDAGRVALSQRYLRHCPLLLVDFPGPLSLRSIYGTLARALLKMVPSLRSFGESLTDAMIDVYMAAQRRFVPEQHPHYIYSPRELSRWVRGMYEALRLIEHAGMSAAFTASHLVRLWLHEALRLFSDRLVTAEEREWMDDTLDEIARTRFGFAPIDMNATLARPVLMSNWLSKCYESVEPEILRKHIRAKLHGMFGFVFPNILCVFSLFIWCGRICFIEIHRQCFMKKN